MADLKISQLTGATTPLAGTEVVPIVQSSTTKKVSVANLTAGRSVAMQQANIAAAAGAGFANPAWVADDGTGAVRLLFLGSTYVGVPPNKPWFHSYQDIYVGSDASTSVTFVNSGANVSITGGNIVPLTAAKGVNFTANTPAAGMTSQLLNWYEEGTWTPVLRFGGGSNSTYSVQIGNYTRIGRQVTLTCTITLTAKGTSTGVATVSGFPFTTLTNVPTVALWQGDSVTFTGTYPLVYAAGGATDCGLFGSDNAGTYTQLTHSNFSNTSTLRFSITYNV